MDLINRTLKHIFNVHNLTGYVAFICVWLASNVIASSAFLVIAVICFIGQDIIDAISGKNNAKSNSN